MNFILYCYKYKVFNGYDFYLDVHCFVHLFFLFVCLFVYLYTFFNFRRVLASRMSAFFVEIVRHSICFYFFKFQKNISLLHKEDIEIKDLPKLPKREKENRSLIHTNNEEIAGLIELFNS